MLGSIPDCFKTDEDVPPLQLLAGDRLKVVGWYYVAEDDEKLLPGMSGSHGEAMNHVYVYYVQP